MSTLSSANVTDVNLVLKERTHMRLCINMLIFTHNLGNWLIVLVLNTTINWIQERIWNSGNGSLAVYPKPWQLASLACRQSCHFVSFVNIMILSIFTPKMKKLA